MSLLDILTQELYQPMEQHLSCIQRKQSGYTEHFPLHRWHAQSPGYTWEWQTALFVRDPHQNLVLCMPIALRSFNKDDLSKDDPLEMLRRYWGVAAQARMRFFKDKLIRHCLHRNIQGGNLSFSRWKDTLQDTSLLLPPIRFKGLEGFLQDALSNIIEDTHIKMKHSSVIDVFVPTSHHARMEFLQRVPSRLRFQAFQPPIEPPLQG